MPEPNDIDRVWDIIENNSIGMLTTQFAGGLRARPLDARPDREAGAIYFVTDARGHKDDEIAAQAGRLLCCHRAGGQRLSLDHRPRRR